MVVLVAAGVGYYMLRGQRFEVEAATAAPPATAAGPTAILQATGYVTARRQATVSAQITGALTQVLIEEGERVKAGQVLARLDDTAQRAAMAQSAAQVQAAQALRIAVSGAARSSASRSEAQPGPHRPASRLAAGARDRCHAGADSARRRSPHKTDR